MKAGLYMHNLYLVLYLSIRAMPTGVLCCLISTCMMRAHYPAIPCLTGQDWVLQSRYKHEGTCQERLVGLDLVLGNFSMQHNVQFSSDYCQSLTLSQTSELVGESVSPSQVQLPGSQLLIC